MSRLQLPNVTIFASMHSEDRNYFDRTLRVLRHCERMIDAGDIIFFSHIPVKEYRWIKPECNNSLNWRIFINHQAPLHFVTSYAMQVHEDGFPIDASQWSDDFFNYDYIGAPWPDKSVGNGGFSLESRAFYQSKMWLPYQWPPELPDTFLCRTHRKMLEAGGLQFAPFEVASKFSCEFPDFKEIPHFGFHGQSPQGEYARAWKILEEGEPCEKTP